MKGVMKKKDGGKISHWQLHHIDITGIEEKFKKAFPEVNIPPIKFSGHVVHDPTGRWLPGYHMTSSYIVSIDREDGIIETENTIYTMDMKTEGQDIFPDLGNGIFGIFY